MRLIRITQEAHNAIRASALGEFQGGTRLPNGLYQVRIEADTLERVEGLRGEGETVSDVIVRICTMAGRKPS
jgi:hypothetical protein